MPWFRFFWALLAVPAWLLLPALAVAQAPRELAWYVFLVALLVATVLVHFVDRRYGPPAPARRLWPEDARLFVPAVVAGVGFTIIGSEIGNVGLSIAGPLSERDVAPLPDIEPWLAVLLHGFVYPLGLVYVVHGVVQKALFHPGRPFAAVLIASLLGSLHAPPPALLQWVFLLGLPGWIIMRSGSLALGMAAFLPSASTALLDAVGLLPGIPGFDVTSPNEVLWQPVWFDVLGAVLIALGCAPLIAAFQGPVAAQEET